MRHRGGVIAKECRAQRGVDLDGAGTRRELFDLVGPGTGAGTSGIEIPAPAQAFRQRCIESPRATQLKIAFVHQPKPRVVVKRIAALERHEFLGCLAAQPVDGELESQGLRVNAVALQNHLESTARLLEMTHCQTVKHVWSVVSAAAEIGGGSVLPFRSPQIAEPVESGCVADLNATRFRPQLERTLSAAPCLDAQLRNLLGWGERQILRLERSSRSQGLGESRIDLDGVVELLDGQGRLVRRHHMTIGGCREKVVGLWVAGRRRRRTSLFLWLDTGVALDGNDPERHQREPRHGTPDRRVPACVSNGGRM
jgi:hypothetical protein